TVGEPEGRLDRPARRGPSGRALLGALVPALHGRRRRVRGRLGPRVVRDWTAWLPLDRRWGRVGDPRGISGAGPGLHDRIGRQPLPLGRDPARSRPRVHHALLSGRRPPGAALALSPSTSARSRAPG